MQLGDRIRDRMAVLGLSQAELGRRVGVSQPAIHALITTNKTGSRSLHRVARELETTPAYLTGETDDPTEDAPPAPELTPEERQVLSYYRRLGPLQRTAWMTIAMSMVGEGPVGQVQAPRPAYAGEPR